MKTRLAVGGLATLAMLGVATPAFADAATAEALFRNGSALFDAGKHAEACDKFGESLKQDPQIGTLKAQAVACEKGGRLATAWAAWNRLVFDATKAGDSALADGARAKAAALEPNLSKLTVTAADGAATPGLLIRRDGQDIGAGALGTAIPVDPGAHVIEATAPGYEVWQTTVTIGAVHDLKTVAIPTLTKKGEGGGGGDNGAANPTKRLVSYIVGGVGVVGIGLGATMGILAMSDKSSATSDASLCGTDNKCSPAGKAKIDSASTKATVSTIGFAVGGAALATGAFLFITSRGSKPASDASPPPAAAFVPSVGPQGGGLLYNGSF